MGYRECLELAGATVIDYEEFGSYQGDWLAYIEYEGKKGFIRDYFGSCSGCDSYEAEIGDHYHECVDESYYSPHEQGYRENCAICQVEKKKAVKFGKGYIDEMTDYDKALEIVSVNKEWDMTCGDMIDFVEKYKAL